MKNRNIIITTIIFALGSFALPQRTQAVVPPPVDVPQRSLPIHGPFEVSLGNLSNSTGGLSANSEAPSLVGTSGSSTPLVEIEPPGPQTPEPTAKFLASAALSGLDPGIAAGNKYLLVSDDANGVAVYEKTGKLLGPKPGDVFPNPFSIWSLFSKVKADIDPQLNYPKDLPASFTSNSGITTYGDVRIMFDSYRKRFWIYAQAKNPPPWDPQPLKVRQTLNWCDGTRPRSRFRRPKIRETVFSLIGGTRRSIMVTVTSSRAVRIRFSRLLAKALTIRELGYLPSISWPQQV